MPPMMIAIGIVRRGLFTSCPTIDAISKPENAKHIDDHKLMVESRSSCGMSSDGANDVAEPTVAKAIAPPITSSAGGIHVAMLPTCWTHLPVSRPRMLMPVQNHRKPRT